MREKSHLALALFIVIAFAASSTKAKHDKRAVKVRERKSLFPGPVTPDRFCVSPQDAGSSQQGAPQEPQGMRTQFTNLWLSRKSVSGNSSVLLLQYAERLVRNRAYFYSLAMQMQSSVFQFQSQPGFLYYYVSAATALFTAPEALVGYGVFFDADKHYPNWYRDVYFNRTVPRFAPRATRQPTPDVRVNDYGTNFTRDYTLPVQGSDFIPPTTRYSVQRRNKFGDIREMSISGALDEYGLRDSDIYYDCVHGDRWLKTFAFPAVEILPRYTMYFYLKNPRYIAAPTVDLDVMKLLAGPPPEVTGFHNMLAMMEECPATVPPKPASGDLYHSFFRSLYPQSRLALRLAHALSAFLQTLKPVTDELDYPGKGVTYSPHNPYPDTPSAKIKADRPMNDTLLEAEVLANLLADPRILASGVFFTAQPSTPRKAFQAWRGPRGPVVGDLSTSRDPNSRLTSAVDLEWKNAHEDSRVRQFQFHAGIRSSKEGGALGDFAVDPLEYRAVSLGEGQWTSPYYKCDGYVDQWVVTYAAPFFGPSEAEAGKLILRGTVTVDITVTADNWKPKLNFP